MVEHNILSNYKIWKTSHIASKALSISASKLDDFDESQIESNQESKFLNRFDGIEEGIRRECLKTYVRPMINKKKARGEV